MNKLTILIYGILAFGVFAVNSPAMAAGNEKILFLHHSTGEGVYSGGNVPSWFTDYNKQNGTSYQISERRYPNTPYPWNNYPYDYWNLWVNKQCNSSNPNIECMNTLVQKYDVVIFKHCFPGADVVADSGQADIASETKSLQNYKLQYRALRDMMDSYPNTTFIVWTLAPLHRNATNKENAARAKQFVNWVKNEYLKEGGKSHPNIHVFDFWGLAAGSDNFLKYEYEGSHSGNDSHPNAAANSIIGKIFAQSIVDAIETGTTVMSPAKPGNLTVK